MKWPLKKIGDVITFKGGGTPRKDIDEFWSDEIPWASVKDFKSLSLTKTQDSISRKGLASSASNLIPAGHVIIPTRMALGKAAINTIDLAINQDLRALIPKVDLDARYLLHTMISLAPQIERRGAGATVKGITQANLASLEIPLPPLAEQKRIAAILDAADDLRTKRRDSLAQIDALLQSTFLDMFGDPVTNPKGWEVRAIRETRIKVQIGPFGSLLHKHDYVKGGIPLINPMHIVDGKIKPGDTQTISSEKAASLSNYQLEFGDVVMGRRGEMGRCAVVGKNEDGMLCGTGSILLRPDLTEFKSEFLSKMLSMPSMVRCLEGFSQGVTMANLNRTIMAKLEIPIPPIAIQERFMSVINMLTQQSEVRRAQLTELDTLFASLQSHAFRGEL